MPDKSVPDRPHMSLTWANASEDAHDIDDPTLFEGVLVRRVLAYAIDVGILLGVAAFLWALVVLTLGLLWGVALLLTPVIPLAYHTTLIGGRDSATFGMRLLGLQVRRLDGGRPDLAQAFVQTALFYASVGLTSMLILLVALFNDRGRCLHDWLSGTVVVRAPVPEGLAV